MKKCPIEFLKLKRGWISLFQKLTHTWPFQMTPITKLYLLSVKILNFCNICPIIKHCVLLLKNEIVDQMGPAGHQFFWAFRHVCGRVGGGRLKLLQNVINWKWGWTLGRCAINMGVPHVHQLSKREEIDLWLKFDLLLFYICDIFRLGIWLICRL